MMVMYADLDEKTSKHNIGTQWVNSEVAIIQGLENFWTTLIRYRLNYWEILKSCARNLEFIIELPAESGHVADLYAVSNQPNPTQFNSFHSVGWKYQNLRQCRHSHDPSCKWRAPLCWQLWQQEIFWFIQSNKSHAECKAWDETHQDVCWKKTIKCIFVASKRVPTMCACVCLYELVCNEWTWKCSIRYATSDMK